MENFGIESRCITSLGIFLGIIILLQLANRKKTDILVFYPILLSGLSFALFLKYENYMIFEICALIVKFIYTIWYFAIFVENVCGEKPYSYGKFQHQIILKQKIRIFAFDLKFTSCEDVNKYSIFLVTTIILSIILYLSRLSYFIYFLISSQSNHIIQSLLFLLLRILEALFTIFISLLIRPLDKSYLFKTFALASSSSAFRTIIEHSFVFLSSKDRINLASSLVFVYNLLISYSIY